MRDRAPAVPAVSHGVAVRPKAERISTMVGRGSGQTLRGVAGAEAGLRMIGAGAVELVDGLGEPVGDVSLLGHHVPGAWGIEGSAGAADAGCGGRRGDDDRDRGPGPRPAQK